LTSANGGRVVGQFKDGKYIGPSPDTTSTSSSVEVRLERQGGILLVPVLINGRVLLDFIMDSGASDVSIPADVVSTLWRTGTLADADFTGSKTYLLADGSTIPSATFRIRSLLVGDRMLENVSGSIAPVKGPLLLGQSFLSRFKSWSVDNVREVLVLGPRTF
jgi:predicted aspartyl protease